MPPPMFTFAVAQSSSVKGMIADNVRHHLRFIHSAVERGVSLVVFPELSLTGYEPAVAAATAITADSPNLSPLQDLANECNVAIIAGCPIRSTEAKPHLGSFILRPELPIEIYRKRFVHEDELPWFIASDDVVVCRCAGHDVGMAICFDISNAVHAADTFANGAEFYVASVAKTPAGVQEAESRLSQCAREYRCPTAMANYAAATGGFATGGRSAIWNERGELVVQAPEGGEFLAIAQKCPNGWRGHLVEIAASN